MLLRHLEYLTALARERHFAHAASSCYVSQPALSAGIRKLESEFDVMIVRRGNRFLGFTPEGERIVEWAQRILAERDLLMSDVNAMNTGLTGKLRLGAIPTVLSSLSLLTTPFCQTYPRTRIAVSSQTSIEIQRRLLDYEVDVGITYIDNEPLTGVRTFPLYRERYVLLASQGLGERTHATWAEAAQLPLCLLTPDMQNRRIVDAAFRAAGTDPEPAIETNSVTALCAHVRDGGWATVMPHAWFHLFGPPEGLQALPLREPEVTYSIGLVTRDHDPESALVRAFRESAESVDMQSALDRLLDKVTDRGDGGRVSVEFGG
jgi:DNA-binding transcriptional LysR family regulator